MSSVLPESTLLSRDGAALPEFSQEELSAFSQNGFVISRQLAPAEICGRMLAVTRDHVSRQVGPVEFEADVDYPGSPDSVDSPGGRTVRRLKQAHARDVIFTDWVSCRPLLQRLKQLLGSSVVMPLTHHNCVMTKQPRFSSDTGWHRDMRYWSFDKPELISVWLALGEEHPENGGLFVIPGSHRIDFGPNQLDERLFFRADAPENQELLESRQAVTLSAGDVLFFHAKTLHAASRNRTSDTKYSAVFTFRPAANQPLAGTRSSACELLLPRD
ncbi:MAG: phytanoyl-CoA dioxygenase family protein [Planctomycetota bacterium]|mgnify:FL=1|nr:phytanoyl-CoA dioxygenase family protein [Planctomycetota bacterium]MDA1248434.1 phytanoyl-CoA dioxygenase family protein [Planctomycetota bacterium]